MTTPVAPAEPGEALNPNYCGLDGGDDGGNHNNERRKSYDASDEPPANIPPKRHFSHETLPENVSTKGYLNRFWKNIEILRSKDEEFEEEAAEAMRNNEEVEFGDDNEEEDQNDEEEEDEDEWGEAEEGEEEEGSSGEVPLSIEEEVEEEVELETESTEELQQYSMIDFNLIEDLTRLRAIDISRYGIKSVKNIGPMIPYVLKINASHNEIKSFLEIEVPPVALKEVNFSHNRIKTVVNLSSFWALTDIDLSYNVLTTLTGFSELEFLQTLNVSHNKIQTINNLQCPNLLILYLNSNLLKEVSGLEACTTLKFINLNKNKISRLDGLKFVSALTDLYITDNRISDFTQFENLRPLLNLTHMIAKEGNPVSKRFKLWRPALIYKLPQLLWLDGRKIVTKELRLAENIFSPSYRKIAFKDHAEILYNKACQAANSMFEMFCRYRPIPPLLLLVGPPRSHCHTLALLLKHKFKKKIYLGGVHSTATTLEGSHPHLDIPVSRSTFRRMKRSGEFLATSYIFGRSCGFSTAQIARAAVRGAVLVANVPLTIAMSLRDWNLKTKLVLIRTDEIPQFFENVERRTTVKRNSIVEYERRRSSGFGVDGDEEFDFEEAEDVEEEEETRRSSIRFSELQQLKLFRDAQGDLDVEMEYLEGENEESKLEEEDDGKLLENGIEKDEQVEEDMKVLPAEDKATAEVEKQTEAESSELEIGEKYKEITTIDSDTGGDDMGDETDAAINELTITEQEESQVNDEGAAGDGQLEYDEGKKEVELNGDEEVKESEVVNKDEESGVGQKSEAGEAEGGLEEDEFDGKRSIIDFSQMDISQGILENYDENFEELHIEALTTSITQTRQEYDLFHQENPGFFHLALEANKGMCESFEVLAEFAAAIIKEANNVSQEDMPETHGGSNVKDEQNFTNERMRDLKKSAMIWSKGQDVLSTHDHVERKPNYYKEVKPREILLEKSSCHSNLLDPSLLRPKITLKMKRIVEVHEKQLKCSSERTNEESSNGKTFAI